MKIAINHRPGSFSDRWIAYCKEHNIEYVIVNAFDSNIITQIKNKDCTAFMWHHHHAINRDVIAAEKILFALEHAGMRVFPDISTAWHFDDKVAQKYLLEAIGAPLVPSYVFYSKEEAILWVKQATFPKVFKLKGGSGSANVRLVKTEKDALKLINKAFGAGFPQFNRFSSLVDRYRKFKNKQKTVFFVIKGIIRLFFKSEYLKQQPNERGYVYFQDFVPGNDSDLRVVVVGQKAFALKRLVRDGDFRASGSGNILYAKELIDERCVKLAFDISEKLRTQSIAYDFIFDEWGKPLIVEVSYGYSVEAYDSCPGYWSKDMKWHEGKFIPQEWMVESLLTK